MAKKLAAALAAYKVVDHIKDSVLLVTWEGVPSSTIKYKTVVGAGVGAKKKGLRILSAGL